MSQQYSAKYWKEHLQLISHIEGGAFREIYRSDMVLPHAELSAEHKGDRAISTSIYFLLEYGEFSALHRIASDELWHFYDGDTLCIYEIEQGGTLVKHLLGKDIEKDENPQVVIKAGSWFGSRTETPDGYTLCGCTVAPGFDFADFELADKNALLEKYPQHKDIILSLT
ncbi:MAG: cupin domain-containing protein [Chitinophagales bacterium]|nr:cupin domain-containing protein [Chitinophagales bacterium]